MLSFITKLFGNKSQKDVKELDPIVTQINVMYESISQLDADALRAKTVEFRSIIEAHLKPINEQIDGLKKKVLDHPSMDLFEKEDIYESIDELIKKRDEELEVILLEILPEAFAVVKAAAKMLMENETIVSKATDLDKELSLTVDYIEIDGDQCTFHNTWDAAGSEVTWNMLHYDVQLIGGIVLHQGKIAEMATGEGKTLVATLPSYLNGLYGGVHIVTVNDYLAKRDSEWMGPLHEFLGLRVDCIDKYRPHSPERIKAYAADITYGTNNEFGFDYLRDNMVRKSDELVQGKLHFAMVDEVDSVLVDDARTPLIISGAVPKGDEHQFDLLTPRINNLYNAQKKIANEFFTTAKKMIAEGNTEDGGFNLLRAHRALPKNKALIKYLSEPGNRQVLLKTETKYLQDQAKDMPLVDKDLFFVIEEKQNSVDLTDKGIDMITAEGEDSTFFIVEDIGTELAKIESREGVSDTEKVDLKDQFLQDYAIKTERLHAVNQLLKAYTLFEKEVEYVVMDGKVKIVDENTGRIMEGRRYSDGLHQAIEAKESVEIEAASQTMATVTLQNYFRMYHKLAGMTGTAETEAGEFWEIYKLDVIIIPTNRPITRDDKQDLVYKTVREKFNAVNEEVVKLSQAGRPVLVGTTSVEASELLSKMLKMRGVKHNVLNAKQHQREADIVAEAGYSGVVTIATNMAGRGTDIKLSDEVKAAGGLAIIGTERHDSRRVDRQLRGRAGRQGDVGSSLFYVSLEDNLMRLFGSERIAKLMDKLGYEEGEVLEHSMITKSIERAQKKVEENNFGVRKRLLEYDDVMNSQREVIYKKRKNALSGERISLDISNSFYDLCQELVEEYQGQQNYDGFKLEMIRWFSHTSEITEEEFFKTKADDLTLKLYQEIDAHYHRKSDRVAEVAFPVIKDVFENKGDTIQNIVVPFTDGTKVIQVIAELKEAYNTEARSVISEFENNISLAIIDDAWKDHLREMDELKQSVQSAVYEQKDPLLVYKFEAFGLFKQLLSQINRETASFIFKGQILTKSPEEVQDAKGLPQEKKERLNTSRQELGETNRESEVKNEPVRVENKVGRNEACPCGSGKKYKNCHG